MQSISDSALNYPGWNLIFVGGTADLADASHPSSEAESSQAQCRGAVPLALTTAGDRVQVQHIQGGRRMVRRLADLGIVAGSEITVVSRKGSGSVIVAQSESQIGIGAGMAHRIWVSVVPAGADAIASPPSYPAVAVQRSTPASGNCNLGGLAIGESGRVVGYKAGCRAYRSKLLSMGLTPGTRFKVTRQAPLGDPIEIEVRSFKLSLRKGEAMALNVEPCVGEEVSHG